MDSDNATQRNELRKLIGQVEKVLGPIADNDSCSQAVGWRVLLLLMVILLLPFFIVCLLIYIPFFLCDLLLSACFENKNLVVMSYVVFIPSQYMWHMIIMISFPIASMKVLYHSQSLRKTAKLQAANQASSVYLIPKELLMSWTRFPTYEEVKDKLKEKKIKDLYYGGFGAGEVLFVSHKWLNNKPDTEYNDIFNKVKRFSFNNINYVWFDFTCIPQSPEAKVVRNQQLFAIATLLKKCNVQAFHVDKTHEEAYQASVWCRLEMMATRDETDIIVSLENMTMFDQNDLYAVLPAFVEMIFSPRYRLDFVSQQNRTKIFVSILRYFIKYHDSMYGGNSDGNELVGKIV
jgi:hypothetical protein